MGGSYYLFPCFSIRKDCKTPQRYLDVPTTSRRISLRSMDSFQGLTKKVPYHGIDRWLQIQIFYDHVSFHLKCEIDRAAGGKLRDKNANESWEIIENLTLYDHEGWNDSTNFVKLVKDISTPQSIRSCQMKVEAIHNGAENIDQNEPFKKRWEWSPSWKNEGNTHTLSPRGPVYEAILKKKITRKEDIGGNFEIPYDIGGLKRMNALVDQGSDLNVIPLSTYMKLTDERPAETNIRLSLASYSYIYPLGIEEDVLVDVAGYITLSSGKSKMSFHRISKSLCKVEKGIKNNVRPIAPTMTVNMLVLEWEERIKLHREKEMKFNQ
ncbi:hypothetical protein Tco_1008521 [Tanacetum coccineum]